ncbi:MAG: hypothetical protein NTZ67_06665 [Gammaproteobacteria bacterium]|nr:hypothetical protein [Gammaproteobacteria bacterium]
MADELLTPEEIAAIKDAEWKKTLARLGIGEVDIRQVRATDILYLAQHWQFLQIVESGGTKTPFDEPQLIEAKSGWTIINYGDSMATSPGKYLYGGGYFRVRSGEDDEDEGGGIVNPKKGTIIKQAFDSASEMIKLAKELGWDGVQIVDGHPDMQRAAWVEACRTGVRLDGYGPDVEAEKTRRRIVSNSLDEMHAVLKGAPKRRG